MPVDPAADGARAAATSSLPRAARGAGERLFAGGGAVGAILAGIDWARSPLGPVETWPQTLRTSLRICLTSRHDMILWWGPDLRVFYNDAYAPTLGNHHPAAAGQPGRKVWAEIWDVIGPMLEGVLRTGQPTWSYDQLLYLERNGYAEETYHTYSYSPIEDDNGDVGGVFTAVTETTPRVLAERRAVVARDMAAALVDTRTAEEVATRAMRALAADANDVPFALLYLLDRDGHHARLAASFGLADEPAFAPPAVNLAAKATKATTHHWPLARVARSQQREVVTDLPRWPGAAAPLARTAHALPPRAVVLPVTEPGQAAPSAILVAGVNPHRALDDDYEGLYALLASHLASALASAHAYEDERRRAEALAEIDRAKTAFFSNVSHEFRTPLTLLLGPVEDSLADAVHPLAPEQRARQEMVRRNGMRLLKLVNTLLDFSRIEAGRVQAVFEPTDLAAYTTDLASAFRSLVEKAGMRLVVECPPLEGAVAAPIYVDREMWEKIVLNLLSNAYKFTFDGEIAVTLHPVDGGRAVELAVRDTGVGVPAAELPRLFERFHRVEGTRARTHEGSGIGLALVQELVRLHGGGIRVQSRVDAGTTFFVRLPAGAAHLPAERVQATSRLASTALDAATYVGEAERWLVTAAGTAGPDEPLALESAVAAAPLATDDRQARRGAIQRGGARQRSARIVLADDNADMREYLARLLSEQYAVEAVANGAEALAAIQREGGP
ncbi:MAG TPA: hybrid sensor histidine kinase/response regulator, partial [Ktedonobacterales bacterium]